MDKNMGLITELFMSSFIYPFKYLSNTILQNTMVSTREQIYIRHCACPWEYFMFLEQKKKIQVKNVSVGNAVVNLNYKKGKVFIIKIK